jgi:hypothetical protein
MDHPPDAPRRRARALGRGVPPRSDENFALVSDDKCCRQVATSASPGKYPNAWSHVNLIQPRTRGWSAATSRKNGPVEGPQRPTMRRPLHDSGVSRAGKGRNPSEDESKSSGGAIRTSRGVVLQMKLTSGSRSSLPPQATPKSIPSRIIEPRRKVKRRPTSGQHGRRSFMLAPPGPADDLPCDSGSSPLVAKATFGSKRRQPAKGRGQDDARQEWRLRAGLDPVRGRTLAR